MIIAHRGKLIARPIGNPLITRVSSSELVIPVKISGRVCSIDSSGVTVLMVSIFSSFPRFGAKFSLQNTDSARNVPDAGIDSTSPVVNSSLSTEYNQRHFLLTGLYSFWRGG